VRKHEDNGDRYMPKLSDQADRNQKDLVDDLITPHSTQLSEMIASPHKIVSSIPAYEPEVQAVQARGRICWSKAYDFQSHGPSYLDPRPE
jgi:hypothetical protein